MTAQKLKGLQSQLTKFKGEAELLKGEIKTRQQEYESKLKNIATLEAEIKRLEGDGSIKVSEHALLRYLERVKGLDLKEIEKEIVSDKLAEWVQVVGGTGTFPGEGFEIRMKNNVITTIV